MTLALTLTLTLGPTLTLTLALFLPLTQAAYPSAASLGSQHMGAHPSGAHPSGSERDAVRDVVSRERGAASSASAIQLMKVLYPGLG